MFDRFSPPAHQVVTRARSEAQQLRHALVGTEHLLLGLVADERSSAGATLLALGATVDGCRSKVREAVGPATGQPPGRDLEFTDRATRALERADRLSLRRRDERVEPSHILLSVLEVEGRAGQVLRGLGVDVADLHLQVLAAMDRIGVEQGGRRVPAEQAGPPISSPRCSACGLPLERNLGHRLVASEDPSGSRRDVVIVYCVSCGTAIGTSQP